MTVPARSVAPAWGFALVALGLTLAAWLWFVLCFTGRVAAWWNSLWLFAALYLIAFLLALRSLHSWLGMVALVVSALSLGLVSLFILR
jgi:hypothetical protein